MKIALDLSGSTNLNLLANSSGAISVLKAGDISASGERRAAVEVCAGSTLCTVYAHVSSVGTHVIPLLHQGRFGIGKGVTPAIMCPVC